MQGSPIQGRKGKEVPDYRAAAAATGRELAVQQRPQAQRFW